MEKLFITIMTLAAIATVILWLVFMFTWETDLFLYSILSGGIGAIAYYILDNL